MKSLGIRGVVLLVLVLAFAVPAFASQPMPASGFSDNAVWIPTDDGLMAVADFHGTFEGVLSHIVSDGRASEASFQGCVDGRCGELEMILVTQKGLDPLARGHEGKWVVLQGTGDLDTLRGQGTFVIQGSFPNLTLYYEGNYHFDPN
jgi:hypothetical protein